MKRFHGVTVYATRGTIEVMHQQATDGREQMWDKRFPGLIPDSPVLAQPVPADGFQLERNLVQVVEVGHTDTDETSVLHVPSIGLVVAVTSPTTGCTSTSSKAAMAASRNGLRPSIASPRSTRARLWAYHKNKDLPDDPAILDRTRQYLLDAIRLLDENPTAREFFDRMTGLYPDLLNPGPVWYGAVGLLGK